MSHAVITDTEFARLFAPYGATEGGRVAVAVSGGPDSMALAFCLMRYRQQSLSCQRRLASHFIEPNGMPAFAGMTERAKPNLLALIVEHGLREESAREAAQVAQNLRDMGIEVEILPWLHDKVDSRIHVQARAARYALLLEACAKHDITTLCLAHHADDQAETILMRFAKGSGIDGLAGMDAVNVLDGVRLVRPLLAIPKARLVATCAAHALPFVTDPSNVSEKYARGRLRRVLPLLEAEGFSPERMADLGARAREAKNALDHYTLAFLREHAKTLAGGAVRLDLTALRGLPAAIAARAVNWILTEVNWGEAYPPERKQLSPLVAWLLDQDAQDGAARTLHGCIVQKGELCDKATILREAAAITDAQPLAAGSSVLWDGRWQVAYRGAEEGLEVRPLGRQTREAVAALAPRLRALVPQGRVRAALPSLWRQGVLVAIPVFSEQDQGVVTATCKPAKWE